MAREIMGRAKIKQVRFTFFKSSSMKAQLRMTNNKTNLHWKDGAVFKKSSLIPFAYLFNFFELNFTLEAAFMRTLMSFSYFSGMSFWKY